MATYSVEDSTSSSASEYRGRHTPQYHDPARDISLQVLEKFSVITRFARETTSQIFQESHKKGLMTYEKRLGDNSAFCDTTNSNKIYASSEPLEVPFYS